MGVTDGCPLGGLVRVNVNCHELTANWGELFISIYGKFTEIRVQKKSLLSAGRTVLWSGIVGNGPGIVINILFKNYSWKIPVYYWAFLTTSTSACGHLSVTIRVKKIIHRRHRIHRTEIRVYPCPPWKNITAVETLHRQRWRNSFFWTRIIANYPQIFR